MQSPTEAVAQAIFIRTDSPDYLEEIVHVEDLGELVRVCATNRPHYVLDRVVVYSRKRSPGQELVLEFVSISSGK